MPFKILTEAGIMSCICQRDKKVILEAVKALIKIGIKYPEKCICNVELLNVIPLKKIKIQYMENDISISIFQSDKNNFDKQVYYLERRIP